jgi:fructokinase
MGTPMLGIDLGGTKIEAVLLGDDGAVPWRERVPTPAGDYDATLRMLVDLVRRGRAAAGGAVSVGVGTPGTVTADGRMKNCNSQCLNGRFLQRDLVAALGQPVAVANDANCLALSEATDGAGAGAEVVFAAILGTGVGAGIAVHGRVLTGPNGVAGEWGHNPLPWPDPATDPVWDCYCGQRGCVETLVSGPGLARDHAAHHGGSLSAEQIARAAAQGDAACHATLDRHASRLARALAGVINLLDPDLVVLGGGLSQMPHLVEAVPRLWGGWVFSGGVREPVRTRLARSRHGDASGVRGAAWLGRAAQAGPPSGDARAGVHTRMRTPPGDRS